MRSTRRSARFLALLAGTALIAAACGSDDDGGGAGDTTAAPGTEAPATEAPGTEAPSTEPAGTEAPAGGGMTLTIPINPDAVWDDGTPITSTDLECTWRAILNTPGSISTVGYDKITGVDTSDPKVAVVTFSEVYAAYKNLFATIIKADAVSNCDDVSGDMRESLDFSGRPWKQESWSPDQTVLVPNEGYWNPEKTPKAARVVMVPRTDTDTEVNALKAGEVGMIFPQAVAGLADSLNDPNIQSENAYGTQFENLWFQQREGPFADPIFREAFSKSVDRDLILNTIYKPIAADGELLNCGFWVPTIGEWCDNTQFQNTFDPAAAEQLLTENGWVKDASGFWAKDGTVPEIRWMINQGNKRREDTQALMIPEFAKHGFKVVADNGDAAAVFQTRLPALDYDLAMYITVAQPDPTPTASLACDQIPSAENNNQGQNNSGWCNEEASALMYESDQELDEATRVEQIHQIGQYMVDDFVTLPLFQFPLTAAWRPDKVTGPVAAEAANYRGPFANLEQWEPVGGDEITIGAEQWPECLNPITECFNSSWAAWTSFALTTPAVWDTQADGTYAITDLVTEEPTVETG